jgi:hypothetical protein
MARLSSGGRGFAVYADAMDSGRPVELFSAESQRDRLVMAGGINLLDETKQALVQAKSTLPFFAEMYNISADLRDHIMVPVVIMPTELPNRNVVGFPYDQLVKANPDMGCLAYQTWVNKPTFVDHVNSDYTKAKGIILATAMRKIPGSGGDLYKIINLCTFDRSRDPVLGNQILTGERRSYSMGAWTSGFACAQCNALHPSVACAHIDMKKPKLSTYMDREGRQQLTYLRAQNPVGFETSSVTVPAYVSATTDHIMRWED